jgi:hypothetical protein
VVACFQWLGRVYVLTDKRVLRIRGVLRADVFQCPLRRITRTAVTATFGERMLALGSLFFEAGEVDAAQAGWICIARPQEVRRTVEEAIHRARGRGRPAAGAG